MATRSTAVRTTRAPRAKPATKSARKPASRATPKAAPVEKEKIVVEVVSFKHWLIVRDLAAYTSLLQLGLPLTKFDEDTLALISPLLRRNGVRLKRVAWTDEFDKLLSKIQSVLGEDHVVQEGHKLFLQLPSKQACEAMKARITEWLERRSFVAQFAQRERSGAWQLRCEMLFDRAATPLFSEPEEDDPAATLELGGNTDLVFVIGKKPVPHLHVRVNATAGGEDEPLVAKDVPFSRIHRAGLLEAAAMLIKAAMLTDKLP